MREIVSTLCLFFQNSWFNFVFFVIAIIMSAACFSKYKKGSKISFRYFIFFLALIISQILTNLRWQLEPASLLSISITITILFIMISSIVFVVLGYSKK